MKLDPNLKKRIVAAKSRKAGWRSILQEAYEYFLPQKENFSGQTQGQRKNQEKTYDGTARVSIYNFANRIQSIIVPPGTEWCSLVAGENVKPELKNKINKRLQDITKTTFQYINSSNMAVEVGEAMLDLAIGTSAIVIQDTGDKNNPLDFKSIPPEELLLEEGPRGSVETVFREFKVPVRNLERLYKKVHKDRMGEQKKDTSITVYEAVVYNPKKENYTFYAIDWAKDYVMEMEEMDISPWIVTRWAVKSGEIYGRGPAMNILPDVVTLNEIAKLELRAAALSIYGMYTYNSDSSFSVESVTLGAGKFIPVPDDANLTPLVMDKSVRTSKIEIERLQDNIKEAMFSLKLPAVNASPHTATEISLRQAELQRDIGSAFGRINNEFVTPVMKRCIYILQKHGIVGEMRIDNTQLIDYKVTSPISRNNEEVNNTLEFFQMLTGMSEFFPGMLENSVKVSAIVKHFANLKGIDLDLLLSDEEIEENQAAANQQNTENEGLAQGEQVANIANKLNMTLDPETGEPIPKQ